MAKLRPLFYFGASLLLVCASTGCSMFHELQIHRLWRLNYGPGTSSDAYYSIEDGEALRPGADASIASPDAAE